MKISVRNVLTFALSLLLLSSCVSTKKYTESQLDAKKSKDQASALEARNSRLKHTNDSLTQQIASIQKNAHEQATQTGTELQKYQNALADLHKQIRTMENQVSNIRQELCSALKCFTPDEVTVKERDGELYVSMYDKLLFRSGSDRVNARGRKALKIISGVLRKNNLNIMVVGHTDTVPIHNTAYNDNWDLSVDRATSVTRVLTKEDKLDPGRVIAAGKGKFQPLYSNKTAQGRKLNRRTDIILVPKLEELYSLIKDQ